MINQNSSDQDTQKFNQPNGQYDKNVPAQGAAGGDELDVEALGSDDSEMDSAIQGGQGENRAENQVRENEDASLQDDSYAFDESNTGNEEYHDASEIDDTGEEDFVQ